MSSSCRPSETQNCSCNNWLAIHNIRVGYRLPFGQRAFITMFKFYLCPQCGRKHTGSGPIGSDDCCICGALLPKSKLDVVRYFWILQIAVTYAISAFYIAYAVYAESLSGSTWERYLDTKLQQPSLGVFAATLIVLLRYRKTHNDQYVLTLYFIGVLGILTGFISACLS
jgi:hypothetical protein